jgi:hypothetical protein
MPAYLARIEPHELVGIYRLDPDRERLAATIPLPAGANLRSTLLDAGWRPTGRRGGARSS